MQIAYRIKASKLDENFLEDLQKTYKDKEIEIIVREVEATHELLKSEVNRDRLLQAIDNIEHDRYLVEINLDNL